MIPVNLIRQYLFCPRIVYFNLLSNIKPVFPNHVEAGSRFHIKQDYLFSMRTFNKLKINYNVKLNNEYMEDESLFLNGIVDTAFICDNEVIPVEYKDINNNNIPYSHKMQLTAYGMLLSKKYHKPLKRGIVIYSNNMKHKEIIITEKDKTNLLEIIIKIQSMVEKAVFPESSAGEKQCLQCEYLNYCDDRF